MLKWVKTHTYWFASLSGAFLTLHFLHYFLFRFYWQPWAARWHLPQLGFPLYPLVHPDPTCVIFLFIPPVVCLNVGDEVKVGDIPKPSLPSILPKKPLPPKSSSSTSSHPPRRPERPPSLASVHRQTHRKLQKGCVHRANVVVWFTCSAVRVPSLRAGLPHQTLPLTGRRTLVSLTPQTGTRRHGEHAVSVNVRPFWSCFCLPSDVDLDAVVSSTERLSHPTASRPRVTDRRPRSQIIAPVSSSHPFSAIIHEIIAIGSCERSRFRPKHLFCVSRSPLCPVSI